MLAKVKSAAVVGLEGAVVEVEVDLSPGLPSFTDVDQSADARATPRFTDSKASSLLKLH